MILLVLQRFRSGGNLVPAFGPDWNLMASLTLKNIPDDLLERLRRRARDDRRSLSQEVLYLLERALGTGASEAEARDARERQVAAWRDLAGTWVSDRPVEEEIAEIYAARTGGPS